MTTVKQQRKGVFRLMLVAAAVLALTVATRKDEPDEPPPQVPEQPPEEVRVDPLTWSPGARTPLPTPPSEPTAAEECLQAWWMKDPVLSGHSVQFVREDDTVYLLDHVDVGQPVLDCLAGAVDVVDDETLSLRFGG
ncbi:MAG: hypothetical protein GY913_26405 [Proteobacteria bacterium]|nr:hypothetical protein [Pseudomonadota bacterium]MCP4920449.1 hypothetical protein [Pseudomonadota bacterium]